VLAQYDDKVYIGLLRQQELVWGSKPVCDIDSPCSKIPQEAFLLSKEVSEKPDWSYLVTVLPTGEFHMKGNRVIGSTKKLVEIMNSRCK